MKTSQSTPLVLQPPTMKGYGAHRGVQGPPRGILGPLRGTLKLDLCSIMVPMRIHLKIIASVSLDLYWFWALYLVEHLFYLVP